MKWRCMLPVTAACLGLQAGVSFAQVEEEAGDPLPTLDELLGTEGGATPGAGGAIDETELELERLLTGEEIADEFTSAVDLMRRSATRLGDARDTGINTQRLQEDVLRKLDKLIADAERRSQQSSSSSSSSQQQSQSQQQQQPDQQQGQNQAGNQDNRGEADPPARSDGPLRPEELADLASWGALPQRLRDALLQGSSDKFSATYRRLTEAYYKMLAEEPKQ